MKLVSHAKNMKGQSLMKISIKAILFLGTQNSKNNMFWIRIVKRNLQLTMRKKARLIGIRDTVIHGQTVPVRVFSSPFEPTFDFETTSSRACAASAT